MIFKQYWKGLLLIGIASAVLVVALQMSQAEIRWTETVATQVEGTKSERAAVGAVSGGILGGIAAAVVGGVGIVAMGTGIGAPAGLGLIAIAGAIGAGGGAVVGAATGTSDAVVYTDVEHIAPAYAEWQWMLLVVVAIVLFVFAVLELRTSRARGVAVQPSNQTDGLS